MDTNEKKRTLLTETPSLSLDKTLLQDAINDSKRIRDQAIQNAKAALEQAFGKENQPINEDIEITADDIDSLISELEMDDDDMVKECRKRLDETKDPNISTAEKDKMYKDIHRKFWAYVKGLPKTISVNKPPTGTDIAIQKFMENKNQWDLQWFSHEGSMVVCSLLAISDNERVSITLNQLPKVDREVVQNLFTRVIGKKVTGNGFLVKLDHNKNFDFHYQDEKEFHFIFGNRMTSIPPNESSKFGYDDVKVERKGKNILIGDKIKLERDKIQNLVQTNELLSTTSISKNNNTIPSKTKVAGRNAFELRTDILELAYDFIKTNNKNNMLADDVIDVAEKFYKFVEKKH